MNFNKRLLRRGIYFVGFVVAGTSLTGCTSPQQQPDAVVQPANRSDTGDKTVAFDIPVKSAIGAGTEHTVKNVMLNTVKDADKPETVTLKVVFSSPMDPIEAVSSYDEDTGEFTFTLPKLKGTCTQAHVATVTYTATTADKRKREFTDQNVTVANTWCSWQAAVGGLEDTEVHNVVVAGGKTWIFSGDANLQTFDGSKWANAKPNIPGDTYADHFTTMAADGDDVWVGGKGVVYKYSNGKWTKYNSGVGASGGLAANKDVRAFAFSGNKVYLAAHGSRMLDTTSTKGWEKISDELEGVNAMSVGIDQRGNQWYGTDDDVVEIHVYNDKTSLGKITNSSCSGNMSLSSLSGGITYLRAGTNDSMYIGLRTKALIGAGGVLRYVPTFDAKGKLASEKECKLYGNELASGNQEAVTQDSNGVFWTAEGSTSTQHGGLVKIDPTTGVVGKAPTSKDKASNTNFSDLTFDPTHQALWVTSRDYTLAGVGSEGGLWRAWTPGLD
jgi:hypothetical protein